MDLLDRMLLHDAWTTRQLLARSRGLSDESLDRRFDLGPGSVRATLVHMIDNVQWWTDRMTGRPVRPDVPYLSSVDQLIDLFEAATAELIELAQQLRDNKRLDDTFIDPSTRPPKRKTFGGCILHLATHNMHHRAQLLFMLRRLGVQDLPEGDALTWECQHIGGWMDA